MARIEKTIEVEAPVEIAYKQSMKFEQYPRFMGGVKKVEQIEPSRYHWVTDYNGGTEFDSRVVAQQPNRKIAWSRESGERNDGQMVFTPLDGKRTHVSFAMDFDPGGDPQAGDEALAMHARRIEDDLRRYKDFVEGKSSVAATVPARMLTTPHLNPLEWTAALLLAIGGINWGLVGWRHYNLIEAIAGRRGQSHSRLPRAIYAAIGVSALYTLFGLFRSEAMTFRQQRKMRD